MANISDLRPGMVVKDYIDYEFEVAYISELYNDDYGECIQISTKCGNTVFYRKEHWDKFTLVSGM